MSARAWFEHEFEMLAGSQIGLGQSLTPLDAEITDGHVPSKLLMFIAEGIIQPVDRDLRRVFAEHLRRLVADLAVVVHDVVVVVVVQLVALLVALLVAVAAWLCTGSLRVDILSPADQAAQLAEVEVAAGAPVHRGSRSTSTCRC